MTLKDPSNPNHSMTRLPAYSNIISQSVICIFHFQTGITEVRGTGLFVRKSYAVYLVS